MNINKYKNTRQPKKYIQNAEVKDNKSSNSKIKRIDDYFLDLRVWANLGQIKEMYNDEVYDIIIIAMIVIILWLWYMKWWVSELNGRVGGGGVQTPWICP